jgi:site-specific DNA recombinase
VVNLPRNEVVNLGGISSNTPFTGYLVKSKSLYYYKCNRIGCKCNRSAKWMHVLFSELLKEYELKPHLRTAMKEEFLSVCEGLMDSGKEIKTSLQRNLSDLTVKLERLEERFAYGEIDREIFDKIAGKLKGEIKSINDQIKSSVFELSNWDLLIDHSLEIITNLSEFWVSGDYDSKRKLQEVLFPGGIMYDKQIGNYRTENVNSVIQLTRSFSIDMGENKSGQIKTIFEMPDWVVPTGIEPVSKV